MEHRKFGYILVSSKDQNEGRQLEALRKIGIIEETQNRTREIADNLL